MYGCKLTNYNADAQYRVQNLQVYASCDDKYGCIYIDGFGAFNGEFMLIYVMDVKKKNVVGCMDSNATNYDADATVQGYDQYGNRQCVYASCDDIPEYGCIYGDGFGPFNEEFTADLCSQYGGTKSTRQLFIL